VISRVTLIVLLLATAAGAATLLPSPSRYHAERWTTAEGLPGDTVRAVLQTRDGYLWIGTQAGLARFDGVRFEVFDRRNTSAFHSDECVALFEDSRGTLWIGTIGGGLVRYRDGEFTNYGRSNGLPADTILWLYEDRAGRLWMTSYEHLSVLDGETITTFGRADGVDNVYAFPFFEDAEGRLWIFNSRGLGLGSRGTITAYGDGRIAPAVLPAGDRFHPIPSLDGRAWVYRIEERDVVHLDDRGQVAPPEVDLGDEGPNAAHVDREGALWLAGSQGTLRRWDGREIATIEPSERDPLGPIAALTTDREGNVWTGTNDGLVRLKQQPFVTYSTEAGLSAERAWTVLEDSRGHLWVGTDSGLNRLRDGEWTVFGTRDGLAGGAIVSIAEGADGRLWFATTEGLSSYDGRAFRSYGIADGLLSENIRAVFVDREGRLWAGTTAGLNLLEGERFRAFGPEDGIGRGGVLFVYQDRSGTLWAGTHAGLARFEGSRFTTFGTDDGLPARLVISAGESADGTLWFGTIGGGLVRSVDGTFRPVVTSPDLSAESVTCVLDDGAGSLWLGTLRGVCRARVSWDESGEPALDCTLYGKADGLNSTDCGGGTQPAGWRARDGRLWFPTAKGVSVVDPAAIRQNAVPPPVAIETVVVDGAESRPSAAIHLPAGSRTLEVRFTALSFSNPKKVRFRYLLEGYDREWVDAGTRRSAFFMNLPPGDYRFRVVAANDDGLWNEAGATLEVSLAPRFYQTAWFAALAVASVVALAWALYRLRVRVLKREFAAVLAERNRIARDLHDSLAQGLTSVSMQLEALGARLGGDSSAAREHLDRARLLVRLSLAEARRTVRDLRSDPLEGGLGPALEAVARSLTDGTEIAVDVATSGTPRPLARDAETALLRAGQEALTNAVRHGRPTRIRVRVAYTGRDTSLEVWDDGRGFDTAGDGAEGGLGLRGMRERVAEAGGVVEVTSGPGRGTLLRATVPNSPDSK
jgi:signal transduction histidine kinase/ligand-binding sensor domain-containing protein